MSSSPPRDQEAAEAEEDPWADKTTELSFSGAAAARHDQDSAGDSSDEDNEAAPDKMEVDNDADREFIWVFPLQQNLFSCLSSLGRGRVWRRGHGHQLLPLGHAHCSVQ